jgi:hypothetical protein
MSERDAVRRFLEGRGSPSEIVAGGLAGLVEDWERTAEQIETGYPLGLDDYLNDLDVRELIEEALEFASAAEQRRLGARIRRADERARAHLRKIDECLWGKRVARSEGWTAEHNWWYFAVPSKPGPLLREDLGALG